MKPPEFLPSAKITFEFASREYWVSVDEYGAATISCFDGRDVAWCYVIRPTQSFRDQNLTTTGLDDAWITRIETAIAWCRVMVDAGHVSPLSLPICLCPATSEYDPPCPRHGVVGIGVTPR